MTSEVAKIDATLEFLRVFKLKLTTEKDLNFLKAVHQLPAVAVVGLVSRGKSTLVNKLIGVDLLATGPNPVTYGNGFLFTGNPTAFGITKKGQQVELPQNAAEFKSRSRRYETQDLVDFTYSNKLRLPENVMLIDTKGLDEISANFRDDLIEMERSWSTQGALGAVLVTSVPPGMSAQDAKLFKALSEHFEGKVLVVVKQTDSSLSLQEINEAAQVWKGHGADVLVIEDGKPEMSDSWGTGPISNLESRLSEMWIQGLESKKQAFDSLEQSIAALVESIFSPSSRKRFDEVQLGALWKATRNRNLFPVARSIAKQRLIEHYARTGSVPLDRDDLEHSLQYAQLGSDLALQHIQQATRRNSHLKKEISSKEIIEIVEQRVPQMTNKVLERLEIDTNQEYLQLTFLAEDLKSRGGAWSELVKCCRQYISSIPDEKMVLGLLNQGGNLLIEPTLLHLVDLWLRHLTHRNSNFAPDTLAIRTIQEKIRAVEKNNSDLSTACLKVIQKIRANGNSWGEAEFLKYKTSVGQHSSWGSRQNQENPFSGLVEAGNRITQVLSRLAILEPVISDSVNEEKTRCVDEWGQESERQRWCRNCYEIINHNTFHLDDYLQVFKWGGLACGFLAVTTLFNQAFAWAILFGGTAALLGFQRNQYLTGPPFLLYAFSTEEHSRSLSDRLKTRIKANVAVFLCILTLSIGSNFIALGADESPTFSEATESPIQTDPPFSVDTTVATTTTIQEVAISDSDLEEDLIQDGRGSPLEAISLPSDDASRISYAFRLSSRFALLPDVIDLEYCWIGSVSGERFCDSTSARRFSQVSDSVIYAYTAAAPSSLQSDSYSLETNFSTIAGRITSRSSLTIYSSGAVTTTTLTLPYLTKRNRYWNADCPRNMTQNEYLPLRLCHEGRGVARVQFLLGVDSDGYFGNTTHNALLDFQFARGLKPTGIVDERTWYELDRSQLGPGVDLNSDGLVTPDEFR
jgi:hypothetical protein